MPPSFPPELVTPMINGTITVLILVWVMFSLSSKRILYLIVIGLVLSAWFIAVLLWSQGGFFLKLSLHPLPNIGLLFIPIIVGVSILTRSINFQKIVDSIPQYWLIGAQITRVMGVAFLVLYARGLMPAEFAIPAGVGDIVIGATAPFMALILFLNLPFGRGLAIAWNIVGSLELIVAIITGFLTSPTPYQSLALNNPNNFLFDFPMALVPVFAVPLALLLHIFSLRGLLKRPLHQPS